MVGVLGRSVSVAAMKSFAVALLALCALSTVLAQNATTNATLSSPAPELDDTGLAAATAGTTTYNLTLTGKVSTALPCTELLCMPICA